MIDWKAEPAGVSDPGYNLENGGLVRPRRRLNIEIVAKHGHLRRLQVVWEKHPVYFITVCVADRRPLLANDAAANILREEWKGLRERHGWTVGKYVVMPDHVHFFVTAERSAAKSLSETIGHWKQWSAKRILGIQNLAAPLWQPEFFDHLLRSDESRSEKWSYAQHNPVRAGLVATCDEWPYLGWIDFE